MEILREGGAERAAYESRLKEVTDQVTINEVWRAGSGGRARVGVGAQVRVGAPGLGVEVNGRVGFSLGLPKRTPPIQIPTPST